MANSTSKDIDIFRDTWIRYLGYANEVGESFRPLVNVNFVRFSYVIACGYVCADSIDKMYRAKQRLKQSQGDLNKNELKNISKAGIDSLIWQSFASVIIPGITINRLVKLNSYSLKRMGTNALLQRSIPTAIGLISIPFIIHPIDNFVHFAMNNTFRPWMDIKGH